MAVDPILDALTKAADQIDKNETAIYAMAGVFSFVLVILIILVIYLMVEIQKLKRSGTRAGSSAQQANANKGHPDDLLSRGFQSYSGLPRANSPQNDYNHQGPPPPTQYRPQQPGPRQF